MFICRTMECVRVCTKSVPAHPSIHPSCHSFIHPFIRRVPIMPATMSICITMNAYSCGCIIVSRCVEMKHWLDAGKIVRYKLFVIATC